MKSQEQELHPYRNPRDIWISMDDKDRQPYKVWIHDKPELCEDGAWRSASGSFGKIDMNWLLESIKRGECKHFVLVEDNPKQKRTKKEREE